MFFADPALGNDTNKTPPPAPYDAVQHLAGIFPDNLGMGGTVIAPDVVIVSNHIFGGDPIGANFTAMGVTRQVLSVDHISTAGVWYLKMNGTYPDWATLWNSERVEYRKTRFFMWGVGRGRGDPILDEGGNLIGWNEGDDSTAARRWGGTFVIKLWSQTITKHMASEFHLDLVNDPYSFSIGGGDSGSGVFIDAGIDKSWLFVGVIGGGRNYFSTPEQITYGADCSLVIEDIPKILTMGGRIQPPSITIQNPVEGFVVNQPQLIIEGTASGAPSHVTVQLDY